MFVEIFSILAPVFVCVGIGYGWSRSGRPFDVPLVTAIVTYFAIPCLVFYTLANVRLDVTKLYDMGLAAIAANILFVAIGGSVLALFKLRQRVYLQSLSFPNIGNVGLPLCLLAFGQEGLALGIIFFAVYVMFQLTIGVAFVAGSFSVKSLLAMPIIPATLLACVFLFGAIEVPKWINNTTEMIGGLTIPLMLFTLGVSLASLEVKRLNRAAGLALLRAVMGFAVGLGLVEVLALDGIAAGVVILQCAMPTAVFCYLFAQLYNQEPEEVAGLVIMSNVIGFASLPALLWYVL